jgi:CubicO group peptidase (beta-lactamase class C family)
MIPYQSFDVRNMRERIRCMKSMTELPLLRTTLVCALGCLAGCSDDSASVDQPASAMAGEGRYSEADEALYTVRFEALQKNMASGAGLGRYDPLEAVPGTQSPEPLPEVAQAQKSISSEALASATAYARAANSSALIVWRKGRVEAAEYFGDSGPDTLLVSRSLAKPITVAAVGRAIVKGHIESLDQPVADFINEWQGTPYDQILVRYLLDMRTGLLPQAQAMTADDILNRAYLHPRHGEVIVHDYPLTHEPGSRYEYSNANSELVALVIERATGVRYSRWVSDEVLAPIGAPGGKVWVNRPDGLAHAGCCILLPAESWLRLGILLLRDGVWEGERLLPDGYVTEMRTATAQNPHAGMGLYVAGQYIERRGAANPSIEIGRNWHSEPYLAEDLFLFDGNGNQVVYIVPSADLVVLRTGPRPPAEPEWDNSFLPNTIISGIQWEPGEERPRPQPR